MSIADTLHSLNSEITISVKIKSLPHFSFIRLRHVIKGGSYTSPSILKKKKYITQLCLTLPLAFPVTKSC